MTAVEEGNLHELKAEAKAEHDDRPVSNLTLKEYFENIKVGSLQPPRKIVFLETEEHPVQAFQRLVSAGLLSAPVWDSKAKQWRGFLDMRDLIDFIVLCHDTLDKKAGDTRHSPLTLKLSGSDFLTAALHAASHTPEVATPAYIDSPEPTVMQDPVRAITLPYLSARNKFTPVYTTDSFAKVCEVLSHRDVHRVPLLDEEGNLIDILSQASLIRWMSAHLEELKKLGHPLDQTVGELKLATSPVITVRTNDSVVDTFRLMEKKGLSGVAVVDGEGRILATTAAADLKLFLQAPSMSVLRSTVLEYLNEIYRVRPRTGRSPVFHHPALLEDPRAAFLNSHHHHPATASVVPEKPVRTVEDEGQPVVCVRRDAKLTEVIARLAVTRAHRVFVVDEHQRPVAVVSMTDILRVLAYHLGARSNALSTPYEAPRTLRKTLGLRSRSPSPSVGRGPSSHAVSTTNASIAEHHAAPRAPQFQVPAPVAVVDDSHAVSLAAMAPQHNP